jgi:hypothetical protein
MVHVAVPPLNVVVEEVHAVLPAVPVTVQEIVPVGVTPPPETVAVNVMVLPRLVGVELKTWLVGVPFVTAKPWVTCGAAFQFGLPPWLALMLHVPVLMRVTLVPETVHTAVVVEVKATVREEDAVALTVKGVWSRLRSASPASVIVWLPGLIVKLRATWGAAFQSVLAAWFALTVQVALLPVTNATVVPETVQTEVVPEVNVTASPDEAVALTVIGPSSNRFVERAPKVVVWSPFAIVKDCWTCVAPFQSPFPDWSALRAQLPVWSSVITPAEVTEQAVLAVE